MVRLLFLFGLCLGLAGFDCFGWAARFGWMKGERDKRLGWKEEPEGSEDYLGGVFREWQNPERSLG